MLLASLTIAASSSFRDFLGEHLLNQNQRTVLSVLEYKNKGKIYKVVKVQKSRSLFIEIYESNTNLQASFGLGKNLNGSIFLKGKATELASFDLDKDGQKEIIVPTLSKNSKSLIFIIKYRPSTNTFSLESPISYIDQLGL